MEKGINNDTNHKFDAPDDQVFNWRLFFTIVWISRLWIILYFVIILTIGYLVGRYSTPVYESQADLQFKNKSQDNSIDLGILVTRPNSERLNEEMTILSSKLYKMEALQKLSLEISYFLRERVKVGDIYTESPYTVDIEILDSAIIEAKIAFKFINEKEYNLKYAYEGKTHNYNFVFGKNYNTPAFNINATNVEINKGNRDKDLFFVINDIKKEAEEISGEIKINADNLAGGKIEINYQNTNSKKTTDVVNIVAIQIVEMSLERKAQSAEMVIVFIKKQIDSLEKQLRDQENILKNFKKSNQIINPEITETSIVDKLNTIDQSIFEVLLEEKSLNWLKEFTNNKNNDLNAIANYFGDLRYSDFSPYLNSLVILEKERENLGLSVPTTDPRMVSLMHQIEVVKQNFKNAIVNAEKKLQVRKDYLNSEQNKYEAEFLALPEKQSEYDRLTKLNELKEKYYLLLLEKQSEYEITLAGMTSDYTILDHAEVGNQISPEKTKILILCLLIAIGVSFAHVYVKFLLHSTILGLPDVEKATNVPILGLLPKYSNGKSEVPQVVVSENPKSHIAESFRTIRSNMQYFSAKTKKSTSIAVTSTVSGEGKTFFSINLANLLAATGKKVILVEFDLRKPKINKSLGLNKEKGVSTVLIQKTTIAESIQYSEKCGCDVLVSGPVPPNPAELLISAAADDLLEYLTQHYDYIIIDNPPIGIVSDSIPLLSKVDLTIYLVRVNYSKRSFIENINRLAFNQQLNNMAIVVNDANASGTGYGYGYGYGVDNKYSQYEDYYSDSPRKRPLFKRLFNFKIN